MNLPPDVFEAAKNGDEDARRRIVEANVNLVRHVVGRFRRVENVDLDDLFSEGCLGLLRAISRFEPKRGNRFSTYATWWIKNFAQRAINQQRLIWVPHNVIDAALARRRGRRYWNADGSKTMDARVDAAEKSLQLRQLDSFGGDDQDFALHETIADPDPKQDPAVALEADDALRDARRRMEGLPDRTRLILAMRLGLTPSGRLYTLEEVARVVGLTRQRVGQLQVKGERAIRSGRNAYHKPRGPRVGSTWTWNARKNAALAAHLRRYGNLRFACKVVGLKYSVVLYRRDRDPHFGGIVTRALQSYEENRKHRPHDLPPSI